MILVKPGDLNPEAVAVGKVGTLLVDSVRGILYMIIKDENGVNEAHIISGEFLHLLKQHLSNAYVLSAKKPDIFDESTMWLNTDLVYVEDTSAAEAYITVQLPNPMTGKLEWKTIFPKTSFKNVIISKDPITGLPFTLESLIKNNRTLIKPTTQINEASKGEIFINSNREIMYKAGDNPASVYKLANANQIIEESMKKSIAIGATPPASWLDESLWVNTAPDGDIINAMSVSLNIPNKNVTGLLFDKDFENKIKSSVSLSDNKKTLTVDLNSTDDYGHVVVSSPFQTSTKSYFEININDPKEKAYLVFLKSNVSQPTSNDYGTQLDESTLLIDKDKMRFKGVDTAQPFLLNGTTIFVMVDKDTSTATISLGNVLDDGTLQVVYGTGGVKPAITMNASHFAIGTYSSPVLGDKTIFRIKSFKTLSVPNGFKGLNNILPGETAFNVVAPLTNAEAIYLTKTQSLANLHAGAGRLVTTPRNFKDSGIAVPGELLLDFTKNLLYGKAADNSVFPIGGVNDEVFINHLANGITVTPNKIRTLAKVKDDPTRLYIAKPQLLTDNANPADVPNMDSFSTYNSNLILRGAMGIVDNTATVDTDKYRMYMPFTDSVSTYHKFNNYTKTLRPTEFWNLKDYLDLLQSSLEGFITSDVIYSSYREFNLTEASLKANYPTDTLYLRYISADINKLMHNESVYLESVKKLPDISDPAYASASQIDKIFNVPEDGVLKVYKNNQENLFIELTTKSGRQYVAELNSNYKINRWSLNVAVRDGEALIDGNLKITKNTTLNTTRLNGATEINGNASIVNPNWSMQANYPAPTGITGATAATNVNIMSITGTLGTPNYGIKLGDDEHTDFAIDSLGKPYWNRRMPDGTIVKAPWILMDDIAKAWNYKGDLNDTGNLVDISKLFEAKHVGYWLLSESVSKVANGFPKENTKGTLEVTLNKNEITQRFTSLDDTGVAIWMRTYDKTTLNWSSWKKTANDDDLNKKYDKAGGLVSGSTEIRNDLKVNGLTTLAGEVSLGTGLYSTADGSNPFGTKVRLLDMTKSGSDNLIRLGDASVKRVTVNSSMKPAWYNPAINTLKPLALEEETKALSDNLATNYYTKNAADVLYDGKVDKTTYNLEMPDKMSKKGDTGTGNYTFQTGTFKVQDMSIDFSSGKNFRLPYKALPENIADDFNKVFTDVLSKGVGFYKYTSPSSDLSSIFSLSMGLDTPPAGLYTSLLLQVDKDGNFYIAGAKENKASLLSKFDQIITMSSTTSDLTVDAENKVATAKATNMLANLSVASYRGLLSAIISEIPFKLDNIVKLKPGNYFVNSNDDLTRLGLDVTKVGNKGVLIVQSETSVTAGSNVLAMTYLPISDKAQNENTLTFISIDRAANKMSKWIYVKDASAFITEDQMKKYLLGLLKELADVFISREYSYTGNPINTSIPYKLIHTHNNDVITSALPNKWKVPIEINTNINLSPTTGLDSPKSYVSIHVRGYSPVSNHVIEMYYTATLSKDASGNTILDKSDVYSATPAPVLGEVYIKDNLLTFKIHDEESNEGLSFDTYVRVSGVGNKRFQPEVKSFNLVGEAKIVANKLSLLDTHDVTRGIVNNSI